MAQQTDISKMETTQTAVEWLFETMAKTPMTNWYEIREQAEAIEKEQIQKAFSDGQELPINNPLLPHYSSKEYYNDTYTQGSE